MCNFISNRGLLLVLFFITSFSNINISYAQSDVEVIKQQLVALLVSDGYIDDIQDQIDNMLPDGSWADVDYESTRDASWPTAAHHIRLNELAKAYADPEGGFYKSSILKKTILKGLDHWITNDFYSSNWFANRIATPKNIAQTLLLLEEDLPDEYIGRVEKILNRAIWTSTGVNKVNLSANILMKGLLTNDLSLVDTHSKSIWEEVFINTNGGEGIQIDYSYHQHGPMLQFGNYGRAFLNTISRYATALRDTSYALSGADLEVLRAYVLKGITSSLWKGNLDFSVLGRQTGKGTQKDKGGSVRELVEDMKKIDPSYATKYQDVLDLPNKLIDFRFFYKSEYLSCKRSNWFASLKMSSNRIAIGESINSENQLGLHLSDGVFMLYQTGEEYINIQPNWDWHRLPGITADQGIENLAFPTNIPKGKNSFAGGVDNGTTGVAAMTLERGDLKANKAWFVDEDAIVCLGSGVNGGSLGDVYTSVQQSLLKGDVITATGNLTNGVHAIGKNNWINHDNIGYELLDDVTLKIETIAGDWLPLFPEFDYVAEPKDVFSIWKNHGQSPSGDTYAYIVYPNATPEEMTDKIANKPNIVSNTEDIQAVEKGHKFYAVFYKAGSITTGTGKTITVDAPCLLTLVGDEVTMSDPNHNVTLMNITISGEKTVVFFPSDAERGKQVSFNVGDVKVGDLPEVHKRNVALLKTVIGASDNAKGPRLVDGSTGTSSWTFPTNKLPIYTEIDLENTYDVDSLKVYTNKGEALQYTVSTKLTADASYETLVDRSANTDKGKYLLDEFTPKSAKFMKIEINGCNNCSNWFGLYEVLLFGEDSGDLSVRSLTQDEKRKFYTIEGNQIMPKKNVKIELYNTLGQEQKSFYLERGALYYLRLTDSQNRVYSDKLVLMN